MNLPEYLHHALQGQIAIKNTKPLVQARKDLSERYRDHSKELRTYIKTDAERYSYLITRFPATYAVSYYVLKQLESNKNIHSLLDLGSGPGTVGWAAAALFPHLTKIRFCESDTAMAEIGKNMAKQAPFASLTDAEWFIDDILKNNEKNQITPHDLITLSYVVGELKTDAILPLIEECWRQTNEYLVIIEPGTPAGFERIRFIRDHLIQKEAYLVAPCPHGQKCPMKQPDWCHFATRIERSSMHQHLKDASLSYEDEKFSYVIFSKSPVSLPASRLVHSPQKRSGHVNLSLCKNGMIVKETISKKDGELYKQAKNLEWGDKWD